MTKSNSTAVTSLHSGSRRHSPSGLARQPSWERFIVLAAAVLAIALLWAFYSIVVQAVGKAHTGRELARAAQARQVVCSAFSKTSSRDLCLLTVASRVPNPTAANGLVQAAYEPQTWNPRSPQLTARLY